MNIGENIRNLRKDRYLSQEQLARMCNISKNAIWNYENNKRKPNIDILNKIADALHVTISELMHNSTKEDLGKNDRSYNNCIKLKEFRENLNLSIEKMSELTNYSAKTILEIEDGEVSPSMQLLYIFKLSNRFNTSDLNLEIASEDILGFMNLINTDMNNIDQNNLDKLILNIFSYKNSVIENAQDIEFIKSMKHSDLCKALHDFTIYYFLGLRPNDNRIKDLTDKDILEIAHIMKAILELKIDEIKGRKKEK